MNFPHTARYDIVMTRANELFAKEGIIEFPIEPFEIIKNNKWGLVTYSELAEEYGVTVDEIKAAFQSEDGYTIYDGTNHTIAYNDTVSVHGRIRFTLMHEIGHIYMNHLIDFDETILRRSNLTETKYKVLENEANSFARNTLAPVIVVKDLKINSVQDLVNHFDISSSAAKTRLKALMLDYKVLLSQYIRFQRQNFKSFIYTFLHSKKCLKCLYQFTIADAQYCPMCSSEKIYKSKEKINLKYDGYEVDEFGRAIECPKCGNEEVYFEGDHCIVCSTFLINKCAVTQVDFHEYNESCNITLPGNARYCYQCGNESTFYQQGLLDKWEDEKKEKEELLPF